ncbi:hypothetical protein N7501_003475 [Penicillium viridicatum]|nr:hypothetical protein N7501_003475 [Penicillium viridicatum]
MVTTSLSSLPNRHQVSPGPVSRRRGINGKQENRKMKYMMNKHGDDVPLFTSQSAPGFPRTGEQKAGDKW